MVSMGSYSDSSQELVDANRSGVIDVKTIEQSPAPIGVDLDATFFDAFAELIKAKRTIPIVVHAAKYPENKEITFQCSPDCYQDNQLLLNCYILRNITLNYRF